MSRRILLHLVPSKYILGPWDNGTRPTSGVFMVVSPGLHVLQRYGSLSHIKKYIYFECAYLNVKETKKSVSCPLIDNYGSLLQKRQLPKFHAGAGDRGLERLVSQSSLLN